MAIIETTAEQTGLLPGERSFRLESGESVAARATRHQNTQTVVSFKVGVRLIEEADGSTVQVGGVPVEVRPRTVSIPKNTAASKDDMKSIVLDEAKAMLQEALNHRDTLEVWAEFPEEGAR